MDRPERDHDMTGGPEDLLRAELREAAAAHVPDRARMLARVERGLAACPTARTADRPRPAPWLRAAGAALAVAAVVAAGAVVVSLLPGPERQAGPAVPAATGSTPAPGPAPATSTPSAAATPRATGATGTPPATGDTAAPGPTARTATAAPPAPTPLRIAATGVIDPGSNRYWAQSDLTLTTPAPLAALTVELRVAQTGGVASTGHWRTLPPEDFTVTVREADGALVYRWTLRAGRTAPAGRHVFAAQYDHAEGARAAGLDAYTVTATDTSGRRATAHGGFTPR
ncbi:hypothetical protein [Streptomyces sp. NPDC126499]|uniref:hypothetical protein n=1 Tax=Streptomyces sp. NPDC126499 TaxID=3155314 RepID=UPI003333CEA8